MRIGSSKNLAAIPAVDYGFIGNAAHLCNILPPAAAPGIAGLLSDLAHGEKVVLTKAIKVLPGILEKLVGTYRIAPGNSMRIDLENGHLVSRTGKLTGYVNSTTLSPSSPRRSQKSKNSITQT